MLDSMQAARQMPESDTDSPPPVTGSNELDGAIRDAVEDDAFMMAVWRRDRDNTIHYYRYQQNFASVRGVEVAIKQAIQDLQIELVDKLREEEQDSPDSGMVIKGAGASELLHAIRHVDTNIGD